jgi:phosphoribosyl-ATP pyrophosphohydrolase
MTALDKAALKQLDRKITPTLLRCADEFGELNLASANDATHLASDREPNADAGEIARLYAALDCVRAETNPRTAQLLESGKRKMGQKLIEEASEVAFEGLRNRARGVVRESADLIYHLVVLWHECGIVPEEVWETMRERANTLGIAEKAPKKPTA